MNQDLQALNEFNGITRLFPLPNLVFFPQSLQPLHIFEPRYREMMADCLAEDRLISLVLMLPGWEKEYDELPPLHNVACLGRVMADQVLPDGRFNILVRGLSRVRILEEIPDDKAYRSAKVELLTSYSELSIHDLTELRRTLAEQLLPRFGDGKIISQIADLFQSELSLGAVCDVLTFALPLPVEWKQSMLEQLRDEERCRMLLEGMEMINPGKTTLIQTANRKFPPDFSSN